MLILSRRVHLEPFRRVDKKVSSTRRPKNAPPERFYLRTAATSRLVLGTSCSNPVITSFSMELITRFELVTSSLPNSMGWF